VEQQQPPALYDQQNAGSDDDVSDSKEEESDEETLQKLNDGVQNLESELQRRRGAAHPTLTPHPRKTC
jgi:hypothetical protein